MSSIRLSGNLEYDLHGYCANYGPGKPCRYSAKLDRVALLERYGDMEIDEFRKRMRCSKCGHHGGEVRLVMRAHGLAAFQGTVTDRCAIRDWLWSFAASE